MEPQSNRSSIRSSPSSTSMSSEFEEFTLSSPRLPANPSAAEDAVYVAVKAELKAGKYTLSWAVNSLVSVGLANAVVLVHVHRPSQMIPIMGGKFPASSLRSDQVLAYRISEKELMNKALDEYVAVLENIKVRVKKLVIETDDVVKGLLELIEQHDITKLVMGAAEDKRYSRKMKEPKSKTANSLKQQAKESCKIWFICKGNLICIREATLNPSQIVQSSPRSVLGQQEQLGSRPSTSRPSTSDFQDIHAHSSPSQVSTDSHGTSSITGLYPIVSVTEQNQQNFPNSEEFSNDPWERFSRSYGSSTSSAYEDWRSDSGYPVLPYIEKREAGSVIFPVKQFEAGSIILPVPQLSQGTRRHSSSVHHEMEDSVLDDDLFHKLQESLKEAENLKNEAHEESSRRRKAEMESIRAIQKAKESENLYAREVRHRKEIEETLSIEKMEVERLKTQYDEISQQLKMAHEQKLELEHKVAEYDRSAKDFEDKLESARLLLRPLQAEYELLKKQRDDAVKEAEEHRLKREQRAAGDSDAFYSEFTHFELEEATDNFSPLRKIGQGGFGIVFKGFLRNTLVAIKVLHSQSLQGRAEFEQEVSVLSRVRHPNLVTLIGACPDSLALIYEYLPNGSLEDCITCAKNSPSLSWQVRTRIMAEICSALIFLHANKPQSVVHGDLKPENILLDSNLTSKLSDFGICHLLMQSDTSTSMYRTTNPKGTFAYMDPEFLTTGELTTQSDIYSFGIIILRLLTGRPAIAIARDVQEALDNNFLHSMIDPSAGDWPFVQAKQLAHLGLRCCEMSRKNRPNLVRDVCRTIEPLMSAASTFSSLPSLRSVSDDSNRVPSYFICPIFQEIMSDPHIAADGFTYEAEAIRGWIDSGHDTSPMTNLKLEHCDLIPNRALRSAIQEWIQQG